MIRVPFSFYVDKAMKNMIEAGIFPDQGDLEAFSGFIFQNLERIEIEDIEKQRVELLDLHSEEKEINNLARDKIREIKSRASTAACFIIAEYFNCSYEMKSGELCRYMGRQELLDKIPGTIAQFLKNKANDLVSSYQTRLRDFSSPRASYKWFDSHILNLAEELKDPKLHIINFREAASKEMVQRLRPDADVSLLARMNLALKEEVSAERDSELMSLLDLGLPSLESFYINNFPKNKKEIENLRDAAEIRGSIFNKDTALALSDFAKEEGKNHFRLFYLVRAAQEGSDEAFARLSDFNPDPSKNNPAEVLPGEFLAEAMDLMLSDSQTTEKLLETRFINRFMIKKSLLERRKIIIGFEDFFDVISYFREKSFNSELPVFKKTISYFSQLIEQSELFPGFRLEENALLGNGKELRFNLVAKNKRDFGGDLSEIETAIVSLRGNAVTRNKKDYTFILNKKGSQMLDVIYKGRRKALPLEYEVDLDATAGAGGGGFGVAAVVRGPVGKGIGASVEDVVAV